MAKATICTPNNICATVYGDTAKIVNAIAVGAMIFIAMVVAIKVLKG